MKFEDLNIDKRVAEILNTKGFKTPTDIQKAVIPAILDGRDILAIAQTGTGKTGAFLIPILDRLIQTTRGNTPKALILVPTRELAQQVGKVFNELNKDLEIKHITVYGGTPIEEQITELQKGMELIIATPGRLVDLIKREIVSLSTINTLVLDEADRMLDMGFNEDITFISNQLSSHINTRLFSATTSDSVKELSSKTLNNPLIAEITQPSTTTELIEQKVYYVERLNKNNLLTEFLRKPDITSAIIFTKTRKSADSLNEYLQGAGFNCDRIHSDRSQQVRENILELFRKAELPILIATDIAARGIDISHISHVFNFELPQEAETYIHRVGRTGRAGKDGLAITLCAPEEKAMLIEIQKMMKKCIPVVHSHTYANIALTKALQAADDIIAGKKEKNRYKGSKANGDYFRRQKMEKRKNNK